MDPAPAIFLNIPLCLAWMRRVRKVVWLMSKSTFPVALEPPAGSVVVLNEALLQPATDGSRQSPRGRIILPLHKDHDENLHRMMNVMQPGTYIRPHRHSDPPKAESIVVLRGGLWFITFENDWQVDRVWKLEPGLGDFGVDIMPGVFHSFMVTDPDTVIFEVKPGPYVKASDKDFASWAPIEGDASVEAYQQKMLRTVESSERHQ